MSTPAFGLYPSPAMLPGARLAAGATALLHTPVLDDGATLFRRSYWLPVPALLAEAAAARLVRSALQLRFAPTRFAVTTGNNAWIARAMPSGGGNTRIDLVWPASVVRLSLAPGSGRYQIGLHRADGDAVADEAAQSGQTGVDLVPPFVATSFEARLGDSVAIGILTEEQAAHAAPQLVQRASAQSATGQPSHAQSLEQSVQHAAMLLAGTIRTLTLAGEPTGPRLRLVAEQAGGDLLLWQALLPGVQAGVVLPAEPVEVAWQPALDQLRELAADPATRPQRLRLDVESDAPCELAFQQLQWQVQVDLELLAEAAQVDFDGQQPRAEALPIVLPTALPDGVVPASLHLRGRVVADAAADALAGAATAGGRRGAMLDAGQAAVQPLVLAQPLSLAGVSIFWRPLSERLVGRLRLLADGGTGPAARALAETEVRLATSSGGWLALRWPAVDLQPQRVFVEWSVADGAGLWLFASAGAGGGWIDSRATAAPRQALPEPLSLALLPRVAEDADTRPIRLLLGFQTLMSEMPAATLDFTITPPELDQLAFRSLVLAGGTRGSVTVESARLAVDA